MLVQAEDVSTPRNTTIQIWYVASVAPQLKAGLPLHVPVKLAENTFWVGLEPLWTSMVVHVCPAAALFRIEVALGTLAATIASTTSFACMPEGGVIDALVAVVIASSLAGMRDSPTIVIGGPPDAAARNVGVRAPPPLMKAELELRKAICACAVLTSVMPASAPISSTARTISRCQRGSACLRVVRVAFMVISCSHPLPALACKKSPTDLQ